MSALDDWNAQYGNLDDFTKATGGPGGRFAFEFQKNYHMRIKRASVSKSSRGDTQVELDLAVLGANDEPVGSHKEWLTLPKQESDRQLQGGVDQIIKVTLRRRDDLARILARVDPVTYGLYASVGDKPGGASVYFDHDGKAMTTAEMDERQVQINARVMDEADHLHSCIGEELTDWKDAEFYIVKAANPKSERYPYTNYYSRPNPKLPMWEGGNDAAA